MKPLLIRLGMALARPYYAGVGSILALHRVVPEGQRSKLSENSALEITPEGLDAAIRYLKARGYFFPTMDELPGLLASGRKRNKFICFTFDDGYKDTAVHAYPVLKRHQVPFSVNITTSYADQRGLLWWYVLEQLFERGAHLRAVLRSGPREFRLTGLAEKESAYAAIALETRSMDQARRDEFIGGLATQAGLDAHEVSNRYLMDWAQIEQLAQDRLVTIGAHSMNHFTLNKLDEASVRAEIMDSRRLIESRLRRPVQHFAYPFGGVNAVGPREFQIARSCGFTTMVTTRCANLFPAHAAHLHCLPRLTLSGNYPAVARMARLESGWVPAVSFRGKRVITT